MIDKACADVPAGGSARGGGSEAAPRQPAPDTLPDTLPDKLPDALPDTLADARDPNDEYAA